MSELHFFASGVVQGVGFRRSAQKIGLALQLTGFIRNLPDGRVELLVQGPKEKIEQFLNSIQVKFQIDKLDLSWHEISRLFSTFEIIS